MLSKLIDINNGDIISVIGSGGKTSFVYKLSRELNDNKVLVSTTTKMFIPNQNDFDFILLDSENINDIFKNNKEGTYFIADRCNDDAPNKVRSLSINMLGELTKEFNVTILECDGAKRKLVKAWESFEPVIIDETTKTVGIINLSMLDKTVNDENIHRLNKFKELTDGIEGDTLTIKHYFKIVTDKRGIFCESKGERILFINGIESKDIKDSALVLINEIINSNFHIDKIIYGSLINNSVKLYER